MSVAYEETETNETTVVARLTGKVKWFNNKAGFGFVTACEGELKDKDVFVHYSSIQVPNDQYKYLVQGEYVDFELSKPEKGDHEFHAISISGVKGGSLMCETRRLTQERRPFRPRAYKTADDAASASASATPASASASASPRAEEATSASASHRRTAPRKTTTVTVAVVDSDGYSKPNRRGKATVKTESK
jgi:CspA family cold shock protein